MNISALISGGCIRLYPSNHATPGPRWHINSGHHTIGLLDSAHRPTIDDSGFLVVKLVDSEGDPNHIPVVSMTAACDETLTGNGISAGCSNGGPIVRIRFYKTGVYGNDGSALNLNNSVHWSRVAGLYNNIWLTLVHNTDD